VEVHPDSPTVSLGEAARQSEKSVNTIRRALADGRLPAEKVEDSAGRTSWAIPIAELVKAGFWDNRSAPEAPEAASDANDADLAAQNAALQAQVDRLESELARSDANLEDLRTAMRMLAPGPTLTRRERRSQRKAAKKTD
jgi:uncharacterized protein YlxW (UPF0749 family)